MFDFSSSSSSSTNTDLVLCILMCLLLLLWSCVCPNLSKPHRAYYFFIAPLTSFRIHPSIRPCGQTNVHTNIATYTLNWDQRYVRSHRPHTPKVSSFETAAWLVVEMTNKTAYGLSLSVCASFSLPPPPPPLYSLHCFLILPSCSTPSSCFSYFRICIRAWRRRQPASSEPPPHHHQRSSVIIIGV